jgi:hypothetical protein
MNIELIGLPCIGKSYLANEIIIKSNIKYKKIRLRNIFQFLIFKPLSTFLFLRMLYKLLSFRLPFKQAFIRSLKCIHIDGRTNYISDEGMITFLSAVGVPPCVLDNSMIKSLNNTIFIYATIDGNLHSERMKSRGRAGIEYNPNESDFKLNFNARSELFEKWVAFLKSNNTPVICINITGHNHVNEILSFINKAECKLK